MRRILLGGFGLALGMFARPAFAQNPANIPATPGDHAARLGVPIADGDAAPAAFTPPPIFSPAPTSAPTETTAVPVLLPTPRVFNNPPNLTEIRTPAPTAPTVPVPPPVAPTSPNLDALTSPYPIGVPDDCLPGIGVPGIGVPAIAAPIRTGPAYRNPQWWASGEYLLWWTRSAQLPTLATTSPAASNGILGMPGTQSVLGGSFGQTLQSGIRLRGGWWCNDNQCRGIDAGFFYLSSGASNFMANTNQFPVLARPFFNTNDPVGPFSELVGTPGLATGTLAAHMDHTLWGTEINYRRYLAGTNSSRLDALIGFRYLNFTENLSITEAFLRDPASPMTVGTPAISGIVNDQFRATNNFYGANLGLTGEMRRGRWFANARTSIAFGTMHETATIGGGQALFFGPGVVGQYAGGLLALPGSNIGTFSQNRFAVVPEIGLNLGYHITPHLRVFVGYNFLYLSNVLRAPGTIDTAVDAARIPNFPLPGSPAPLTTTTHPAPQFNTTDLWAQGISFGLQWSW